MKKFTLIFTLLAIAVAGCLMIMWHKGIGFSTETSKTTFYDARLASVKPMLELCATEIYREVPVKASIGSKHLFARQVLTGRIGFNVDSLQTGLRGDTVVVKLPPETIVLRESTLPRSYEVIDTWKDEFWSSNNFSNAEENAIKRRVLDLAVKHLYSRGDVARARKSAAENLQALMSMASDSPVVVVDESPCGYPELNIKE